MMNFKLKMESSTSNGGWGIGPMIGIEYNRMIMIDKHILKHQIGYNNKLRDVLNQKGKADECPRENIR